MGAGWAAAAWLLPAMARAVVPGSGLTVAQAVSRVAATAAIRFARDLIFHSFATGVGGVEWIIR
jgi:hypothetical protein